MQIEAQKKELEKAKKATTQAEQDGYDIEVKETEEALRAQVTRVCRGYCLQVWTQALNLAEVGASSRLRKTENIFYPPALRITAPSSSRANTTHTDTLLATSETSKEPDRAGTKGKEKEATKEKVLEPAKLLPLPKETSKEKEATQGKMLEQAKLPSTTQEVPKEKGVAHSKVSESSAQPATKADPPPFVTNQGFTLLKCISFIVFF